MVLRVPLAYPTPPFRGTRPVGRPWVARAGEVEDLRQDVTEFSRLELRSGGHVFACSGHDGTFRRVACGLKIIATARTRFGCPKGGLRGSFWPGADQGHFSLEMSLAVSGVPSGAGPQNRGH